MSNFFKDMRIISIGLTMLKTFSQKHMTPNLLLIRHCVAGIVLDA
jgi:hypothetical protein